MSLTLFKIKDLIKTFVQRILKSFIVVTLKFEVRKVLESFGSLNLCYPSNFQFTKKVDCLLNKNVNLKLNLKRV